MKPATWIEEHTRSVDFPRLSTLTLARGALLIVLGFLIWVGLWQLRTPDPAPASTAETGFSADRALVHLEAIANESRAIGEPGHLAAREYLVEQIRAMELEPEIQTAPAHVRFEGADGFSAGTVKNDAVEGDLRTLDLRIASPRGAPEMRVRVDAGGEIVAATLDGRELDLADYLPAKDGVLQFGYSNNPPEGFELTITVRSSAPVTVTLQDSSTGFPEIPGTTIEPRPADMMPAPLYPRDATEVLVEVGL